MEKRLLLAITLSFFILYSWSLLFPAPKPPVKISQHIDNKEDVNTKIASSIPSSPLIIPSIIPQKPGIAEKIITLETDKLAIDFSNVGGNIKKTTIKEYGFAPPC